MQLFLIPVLANVENVRNYILESVKRVFIPAKITPFHLEDSRKLGDISCDFFKLRVRAGPHLGFRSHRSL